MSYELLTAYGALLAALAAVCALAYQIYRDASARSEQVLAIQRAEKLRVIADLVENRYVLTAKKFAASEREEASRRFNTALSRTPIHFVSCPKVIRLYSEIGESFNGEKFFDLIKAMLTAADVDLPAHFTKELIESIPTHSDVWDRFV